MLPPEPPYRRAARALLLDPDRRLLLLRFVEPREGAVFWATPGGGLEPGEDQVAAIRRELYEELGLTQVQVGPCVWERKLSFVWDGRAVHQREWFYLCHVQPFEVQPPDPTLHAREQISGHRWWTIPEILGAREVCFAPTRLGLFLEKLLLQGPPPEPLPVGF